MRNLDRPGRTPGHHAAYAHLLGVLIEATLIAKIALRNGDVKEAPAGILLQNRKRKIA